MGKKFNMQQSGYSTSLNLFMQPVQTCSYKKYDIGYKKDCHPKIEFNGGDTMLCIK